MAAKKKAANALRVQYRDGRTEDAEVIPADRVAFERRYGIALLTVETPLEEYSLYLAFVSLRRQGYTEPGIGFDHWMLSVAAVDG